MINIRDLTGSYDAAFWTAAGLSLTAALLSIAIPRRRPPSKVAVEEAGPASVP